MKFTEIEKLTSGCNCFEDTENVKENCNDVFARRVQTAPATIGDFQSYAEMGKREKSQNCDRICSAASLSINKWDEGVLETYRKTIQLSPQAKSARYVRFKFKHGAGKVQATPSNNSASHCNFYKCDDFALGMLDILDNNLILTGND